MKFKPSASYRRGGYNSNKFQPYSQPGPVTYPRTPGSEHYQDPVTMEGTVLVYCCVLGGYEELHVL
jgi:hypothetical protein